MLPRPLLLFLPVFCGCQALFSYDPGRQPEAEADSSPAPDIQTPNDAAADRPSVADAEHDAQPPPTGPTMPIELPASLRWQWEHPSTFGEGLAAVWVDGDAVFVGAGRAPLMSYTLRFSDGAWNLLSDRLPPINDIWASGTEVLAATRDDVRRYDGAQWRAELENRWVLSVTGDKEGLDRFALTTDRVHQHDGSQWNNGVDLTPDHARGDLWCCHEGQAYLGGEHGAIMRWDGENWETLAQPPPCMTSHALWVDPSGAIFIVGPDGCAGRRDPSGAWEALPTGSTASLEGIWGVDGNEVFAVGNQVFLRFDGSAWNPVVGAPEVSWQAVAGDGANLVAVAEDGTIGQYRAGQWRFGTPTRASTAQLRSVWCDGQAIIAAGSSGIMRRSAAGGWKSDPASPTGLSDIWASSPQQIFALDTQGAWRSDGLTWKRQNTSIFVDLQAVHGCANEVYVGGQNGILRLDTSTSSATWEEDWIGSGKVEALWCGAGTAVYAGLFDGRVLRREAPLQWTEVYDFGEIVWDIWASGPDDLWIVGHTNQLAHWDGFAWRLIPIDGGETWWPAITGTGPDNILLVGPNGSVFHYDGNAAFHFSREVSTTVQPLRDVCSTPSGAFVAVGDNATILRRAP